MRKLNPVSYSDSPTYADVVSSKHEPRRQRLVDLQGWLLKRYREAQRSFSQERCVDQCSISEENGGDLLHCYSSPTASFKMLRVKICTDTQDRKLYCCYCLSDLSETLDHFMPRESFPDLAIMPENLIPCCHTCNAYKSDDSMDLFKKYINPYYTNFACSDLLCCKIHIYQDIPLPKYYPADHLEGEVLDVVKAHLDRLRIRSRYLDHARIHLPEIFEEIKELNRTRNLASLSERYSDDALRAARHVGNNHWRPLLLKAVSEYLLTEECVIPA